MILLRFCFPHVLILCCFFSILAGGWYPWIFFLSLSAVVILGDYVLPEDYRTFSNANPMGVNALLFAALPNLLLLISATVITTATNPTTYLTFIPINYVHPGFSPFQLFGIVLSVGLLIGGVGTSVAHECSHRKSGNPLTSVGNWLMALSMDSVFPIEHNHGHHKNVGTLNDAATARRGENVYKFIFRSTSGEHINAWRIERNRLSKRDIPFITYKNRYLRGITRSLILPLTALFVGGVLSAFVILSAMIWAKILLEAVNYIEHYGLVRIPGKPIESRHSWNSNAWVSSTITFFLTRHSHHHQKSSMPFWKLEPLPNAPTLPWGYLSGIYLALLTPTFYRKIMEPKLRNWFQTYATSEERQVASFSTL